MAKHYEPSTSNSTTPRTYRVSYTRPIPGVPNSLVHSTLYQGNRQVVIPVYNDTVQHYRSNPTAGVVVTLEVVAPADEACTVTRWQCTPAKQHELQAMACK
jgi:hypothetical protein